MKSLELAGFTPPSVGTVPSLTEYSLSFPPNNLVNSNLLLITFNCYSLLHYSSGVSLIE